MSEVDPSAGMGAGLEGAWVSPLRGSRPVTSTRSAAAEPAGATLSPRHRRGGLAAGRRVFLLATHEQQRRELHLGRLAMGKVLQEATGREPMFVVDVDKRGWLVGWVGSSVFVTLVAGVICGVLGSVGLKGDTVAGPFWPGFVAGVLVAFAACCIAVLTPLWSGVAQVWLRRSMGPALRLPAGAVGDWVLHIASSSVAVDPAARRELFEAVRRVVEDLERGYLSAAGASVALQRIDAQARGR